MLVALFIFAAVAFVILGIGMIVGRKRFAQNVPQGSGLPTTPSGVLALGCFALAAAVAIGNLTAVNLVALSRQSDHISATLSARGTGTRMLGLIIIVVALSLAFGAGLIAFSLRRGRTASWRAGQRLPVRQRVLYAAASAGAGVSIALIAAGLSIVWLA